MRKVVFLLLCCLLTTTTHEADCKRIAKPAAAPPPAQIQDTESEILARRAVASEKFCQLLYDHKPGKVIAAPSLQEIRSQTLQLKALAEQELAMQARKTAGDKRTVEKNALLAEAARLRVLRYEWQLKVMNDWQAIGPQDTNDLIDLAECDLSLNRRFSDKQRTR